MLSSKNAHGITLAAALEERNSCALPHRFIEKMEIYSQSEGFMLHINALHFRIFTVKLLLFMP